MPRKPRGLASSRRHCAQCERRWTEATKRPPAPAMRSCAVCRYFVPSAGDFAEEWGACANPASSGDRRLKAGHEGCADFAAAAAAGEPAYRQAAHFRTTHDRWGEAGTGNGTAPTAQCGDCRYFIPLDGAFIEDWGVCSNRASALDGEVVLEHHGCAEHERAATGWGGATPRRSLERRAAEHPDRAAPKARSPATEGPPPRRIKPAS